MQVFLFHVPLKTEKQVAQLLRPYGISVRTISREQYTVPLGVLLGLRKAGRMLPSLGLEFAEPMLLMHGLPDDMVDAVLAQLFDRLCELGTAYTTDKLNNVLDDASQTALARILAHQLPEGDMDKLMQDCLRQMRRLRLEKEYEKHRLLADEYERSADERFLSELMESQRIKNEIKKLYGNQNK